MWSGVCVFMGPSPSFGFARSTSWLIVGRAIDELFRHIFGCLVQYYRYDMTGKTRYMTSTPLETRCPSCSGSQYFMRHNFGWSVQYYLYNMTRMTGYMTSTYNIGN